MTPSHLVSFNLLAYSAFLQEMELTEKARTEDQEFDELVAFIQQRLSQTEVTYFWADL